MTKQTLSWIISSFVGLVLLILGGIGSYLSVKKPPVDFFIGPLSSIILLSIGCSIVAATLVDVFNSFYRKEFKDHLIERMSELFKTSEEWGLLKLVPSGWDGFYNKIRKSSEIKYFAFNAISIFSEVFNRRKAIVDFLNKGGKIDVVTLDPSSKAFEVRRSDWDERSEIFESEHKQVGNNILLTLKDLKQSSPHQGFRVRIRSTDKFVYGNLIIFDKELYHYTLNSSTWKFFDGVTIHARAGSKLSALFDMHFEKIFSNGRTYYFGRKNKNEITEIDITYQNIDKYIDFFSQDCA